MCMCDIQHMLLLHANSRVEAIRRGRHFSQQRVVLNQSGCICPPKQQTSRYTNTTIISTLTLPTELLLLLLMLLQLLVS